MIILPCRNSAKLVSVRVERMGIMSRKEGRSGGTSIHSLGPVYRVRRVSHFIETKWIGFGSRIERLDRVSGVRRLNSRASPM